MLDATGEAHDEEGVMSALPSLPFSACVSSSNIAARKQQQQQQRFNNALTSSKSFPSGKRFGGGGNDDDDDGVIACSEKLVRERVFVFVVDEDDLLRLQRVSSSQFSIDPKLHSTTNRVDGFGQSAQQKRIRLDCGKGDS